MPKARSLRPQWRNQPRQTPSRNPRCSDQGSDSSHTKTSYPRSLDQHNPQDQTVYGALDMGSNCCKLIIVKPHGQHYHIVNSYSRVVGLANGLDTSGKLSDSSMRRAFAALNQCQKRLQQHPWCSLRAVATEAFRRASNAPHFLMRIHHEIGLPLQVIHPLEEAHLAVAGCVDLLDPRFDRFLLLDIGGASTELIVGRNSADGNCDIVDVLSIPTGVVSLTGLLGNTAVQRRKYRQICADLQHYVESFILWHALRERSREQKLQILSASGTSTTLVGILLGQRLANRAYVDGAYIQTSSIYRIAKEFSILSVTQRSRIPALRNDRTNAFIAGCIIIEAICRSIDAQLIRVANRGLRDGILSELMGRTKFLSTKTLCPTPWITKTKPSREAIWMAPTSTNHLIP